MPSNDGFGTATLGEMIFANSQAASAAAAAAVSKEAPAAPIIPAAANEAAARLSDLKADPKWRDQYLKGSSTHAKEMRDLQAVVDKEQNTQVDMAIAGKLYDGIQPGGHLAAVGTAEMLREAGIGDAAVIRQVLAGEEVTPQEHAAATETKERLMKDQDFVKKYMTGDGDAKRQMTLLNVVLSSPVKTGAAA